MDIEQKIERSKSSEKIDFAKIGCLDSSDKLVAVEASDKWLLDPIWKSETDFEGKLYAQYIKSNPEYNQIYVRSGIQKMLNNVTELLSDQYKLVVRAGHRPIQVQKQLFTDALTEYAEENPEATDNQALKHVRTYISDPNIKLPPHCCGAAVDVELFDVSTNKPVNFGCSINTDSDISYIHSNKISKKEKQNRMILLTAMLEAGFASYYAEWWHFSYGDQLWAWFYGKDACLYGFVEL